MRKRLTILNTMLKKSGSNCLVDVLLLGNRRFGTFMMVTHS